MKLIATYNECVMSPVQRSVKAKPHRRMYKDVLRDWVFQIVAIIKEFPAIATGDKMAMKTEAERDNAWKEKL